MRAGTRALRQRFRLLARDERGSAVVEFVLVGVLLTVLTLSVLQLGLALLIRNTVHDAAGEGARFAALADNGLADGVFRAQQLLTTTLGPSYATDVSASLGSYLGHPAVVVTVRAPLPLVGLVGIDEALEVTAHAAVEPIDR